MEVPEGEQQGGKGGKRKEGRGLIGGRATRDVHASLRAHEWHGRALQRSHAPEGARHHCGPAARPGGAAHCSTGPPERAGWEFARQVWLRLRRTQNDEITIWPQYHIIM